MSVPPCPLSPSSFGNRSPVLSWVHGLSEPSLHFPVSLDVIWPMGCGECNLKISLGAVQETEFTLSVLSEMGLNKEVGAYKVIVRAGSREAVG